MNIYNHTNNKLQSLQIQHMMTSIGLANDPSLEVWAHTDGLIVTKDNPQNKGGAYLYRLLLKYTVVEGNLDVCTGTAELILPYMSGQRMYAGQAILEARQLSKVN